MMDDLISRQAAIEAMREMYHAAEKWGENASEDMIKARAESCMASLIEMKLRIENFPSAVVRCKECKWRDEHSLICANDDIARRIDDCGCYPDFMPDPDWFCAYGERKDDAEIH